MAACHPSGAKAASQPTRRSGDAVEHTVHESRCPRAAEPVGQPDRLVDRHLGRHVPAPQLVDGDPQDVAARPRRSGSRRQFSAPRAASASSDSTSATTPSASASARSRRDGSGPVRRESPAATHSDGLAPKLPGVEQLERAGATLGLNPEHGSPAAGRSRLPHREPRPPPRAPCSPRSRRPAPWPAAGCPR